MEELMPTGPVIGIMEEPEYEERVVALKQGDVLVMYTDGVSEALNGNKEMFSEERLHAVVRKNHSLSAHEIVSTIHREVETYCGSEPQFDDMTIMVLKAE
jgi:sigma-B regulation protein RsbU (phosphoserine phosphatase)